jgi:tetratricopeptide (TPR) repeat protein
MTAVAERSSPAELRPKAALPLWPLLGDLGIRPPADLDGAAPNVEEDEAARLVRLHPGSSTALARLARAQLSSGKVGDAIATAATISVNSSDEPALVVALQTLLVSGELDRAESLIVRWQEVAISRGESLPIIAVLAHVSLMARRGETEGALELLEQSEASGANVASMRAALEIASRRYEPALRDLRRAILLGPPSPTDYTNLGYLLGLRGALKKAIQATQVAARLAPAYKTANMNLANFYLASGDPKSADQVLQSLSSRLPSDPQIVAARAGVQMHVGNYRRALQVVREALSKRSAVEGQQAPSEWLALVEIARWKLGRISERQMRERLLEMFRATDAPPVSLALDIAYASHNSGDLPTLRDVRRRMANAPDSALRGIDIQIAIIVGDFDEALRLSRQWMYTEPFNNAAALVVTYLEGVAEGRLHECVRMGEDYLRRMPADLLVRNNVAFAKALLGDHMGADRLLILSDAFPNNYCTAALIALARGDTAVAEELYAVASAAAEARGDETLLTVVRLYREVGFYWFSAGEPPSFASLSPAMSSDSRVRILKHAWKSWIQFRQSRD